VRALFLSSVVVLVATSLYAAVPEPAIVPAPGDWTLEVRFEHPQQIILPGTHQRYWYMILTLTNRSGVDVDFYPTCVLMTDTLQLVPAIKGVSAVLFEKIKIRHQGRYPFLQLVENVSDKILQGEDNTVDIVVIWPDFDPNARGFDIFICGLSNETAVVYNPVQTDADGDPVKVYLRKTLRLGYKLSGDPAFRSDQKLTFEGKSWVMR